MKPFSHPNYAKNNEKSATGAGCPHCGKDVKDGEAVAYAHIVAGGSEYGGEEENYNDPGEMGWFAVGSTCAKVLKKHGVFLQMINKK